MNQPVLTILELEEFVNLRGTMEWYYKILEV